MMASRGNYPKMVLFQVSELYFSQIIYIYYIPHEKYSYLRIINHCYWSFVHKLNAIVNGGPTLYIHEYPSATFNLSKYPRDLVHSKMPLFSPLQLVFARCKVVQSQWKWVNIMEILLDYSIWYNGIYHWTSTVNSVYNRDLLGIYIYILYIYILYTYICWGFHKCGYPNSWMVYKGETL